MVALLGLVWCGPVLLWAFGCGKSPAAALDEARTATAAQDDAACQTAFRQGLEHHPDDVELLILAAEFYLRSDADDHYKPRLAIHYAQRADRAAGGNRADAAAVLVRALRAMGQDEDATQALGTALERHPDAPELKALEGATEVPSTR